MKEVISFNNSQMAFIKQANNGNQHNQVSQQPKKEVLYYTVELTEEQRGFLDTISAMEGMSNSELVWYSVSFVNTLKEGITVDFIRDYSIFVTDKKDRTKTTLMKKMSCHEDLKGLKNHFKSRGFRISLKGVLLLCALKYAEKHLKFNISKYKNFSK